MHEWSDQMRLSNPILLVALSMLLLWIIATNTDSKMQTPNDNSQKGAFQCRITCKYGVSILRVLDSPQRRLTCIFETL